jgi:serine/threonine protein kinase
VSVYHENALEPGSSLAEYTIESVLGHGGFGITYLASDTTLGSQVAIKEYLPQDIATRTARGPMVMPRASREAIKQYHWGLKNFVKEARALARFKHPNIVRVLRFIEANGTAYTVMEYEEGQTLAQHLNNLGERLDESALFRIIMPILNGLHAVHEARLLHLDIKPENIYLRRDGHPMLIDFGSARQAMAEGVAAKRVTLTHGYAPIEQYPDKGSLGPWSDVYAIGATLYRCVTGKRPQDSIQRYRAVLDYKTDPLQPATQAAAKHYPSALLECIDAAIQVHAKDRPQSARELQNRLTGPGGRAGGASAGAVYPPRAIAPGRRAVSARAPSRRSYGFGMLLLVLALAAGAWYAWPMLVATWEQISESSAAHRPASEPVNDVRGRTPTLMGSDGYRHAITPALSN